MAQTYDGAIRIATKIDTSDFKRLVNEVRNTEKDLASLKKKLDELGKAETPTHEYKQMQAELKKAEEQADKLYGRLRVMEKSGDTTSAGYRRLVSQIKMADQQIDNLREGMAELEASGKAFVPGNMTEEYAKAAQQVERLNQKLEVSRKKLSEMVQQYRKNTMKKTVSSITKVAEGLQKILRGIDSAARKAFGSFSGQAQKASKALNKASFGMRQMLISSVAFSAVFRAISAVTEGVGQGFTNLMGYSDALKDSIQDLKNSLSTLGNSFAAAFSPIIQAAIPYLVQLINWITRAINAVAQLFAYLTGKSTWTKATEIQAGYNDELNGTADAAKKAYGALAKFDDLDVLQKQDSGGGAGGSGGATTGGFEEVPISEDIRKFGDQLKDIFSKIFAPLKEAWEREGQFVMDAWKYALEEIGLLVRDIGRDFLEVWNQEETINMFQDILRIVGDIGLTVGNLAHNFREAWNENQTGLHILENIRDILAVIIHNIRLAADATVEWSKHLDFSPLLTAFERFTAALVPAFDALSGILMDFYTQVLLPLSKWALEDGLPDLLDVLTDFVKKVDWEGLRKNFSNLWDSLEPFAETVGEGLIIFLGRVSDLVANFLNSDELEDFLDHLADWMDSVEPEDVADAIEWLAKALISLKVALTVVNAVVAVSKLIPFLSQLKALGVVTAGVVLVATGVEAFRQFAEDFKYIKENGFFNWQENNRENGKFSPWNIYDEYEPRDSEPYNPYDDMDFSWMDEWSRKFEEWQANNRTKRAEEKAEFDTWFEELKRSASETLENIKTYWSEKWDGVQVWFETNVQPWFTVDRWTQLFENIKTALQTKWNEIVVWWQESALYTWWTENVTPWFTIERWMELVENVRIAFVEKWTEIKDYLTEVWELIKKKVTEIWTNIREFINTKWTEIKDFTSQTWNALKKFLSDTWENIRKKVTEIFDAVRRKLKEVWDGIKREIEEKIDAVKEKIDELIEGATRLKDDATQAFNVMKNNVVNALSPIIDKIREFIDWVGNAIQAVRDFFSSGYDQVGSSAAKTSKASARSSVLAMAMQEVGTPSVADAQSVVRNIPHLASGAVIRGGKPFAAILGDQPAGQTNVEAPESVFRNAVRDELNNFMGQMGGALKISVNVNGEDLAQVTLQDFLSEMGRQGYNVDLLGWQS